jgi:carbon-monoxide dehydrogenase large subunit
MDYLPPTTSEVPQIEVGHIETESTTNPGGYKGMGEGGAIGAHAAVANAVADALRPLGVKATTSPLGPDQILALVEAAKRQRAAVS